jgi:hypothetical protein
LLLGHSVTGRLGALLAERTDDQCLVVHAARRRFSPNRNSYPGMNGLPKRRGHGVTPRQPPGGDPSWCMRVVPL